ncbi:MAG: hypothetical protein IJE04_01120 [Bacilli bacterium]|nr:hypothetical protein [Bacilli bacterium]
MEPINIYQTRKLIYQIMFDFYENNYEEEPNMFSLNILKSLEVIVEYHTSQNDLSRNVIDNIGKFLMAAREYKDENRNERIEIINNIIRLMNNQEKDQSLVFYRIQLYSRTKEFRYLFQASDAEIISQINNIHDSICNDLFVLVSHSSNVSDEEFIKEYLTELKDSDLYYESLNVILKENPLVFKDQLFYNRMICVLEYNNLIYEDLVEYNQKLVKKIDKKVKKIKLEK